MKIHETAFHVINCHVPVCHAVVPSRKWTMWLFRYVIVISYKCSITSTEVAPHPAVGESDIPIATAARPPTAWGRWVDLLLWRSEFIWLTHCSGAYPLPTGCGSPCMVSKLPYSTDLYCSLWSLYFSAVFHNKSTMKIWKKYSRASSYCMVGRGGFP